MTGSKMQNAMEGIVVALVGVIFMILSLGIQKNPVVTQGPIGMFVEAKFIPFILALLITIQGVRLAVAQYKGTEASISDGGLTKRAMTVMLLTLGYLVLVSFIGFSIPTPIYVAVLLYVVNEGHALIKILAITAFYYVLALFVIPILLNLQVL